MLVPHHHYNGHQYHSQPCITHTQSSIPLTAMLVLHHHYTLSHHSRAGLTPSLHTRPSQPCWSHTSTTTHTHHIVLMMKEVLKQNLQAEGADIAHTGLQRCSVIHTLARSGLPAYFEMFNFDTSTNGPSGSVSIEAVPKRT
jgi:hypothetical protein